MRVERGCSSSRSQSPRLMNSDAPAAGSGAGATGRVETGVFGSGRSATGAGITERDGGSGLGTVGGTTGVQARGAGAVAAAAVSAGVGSAGGGWTGCGS